MVGGVRRISISLGATGGHRGAADNEGGWKTKGQERQEMGGEGEKVEMRAARAEEGSVKSAGNAI